MEMNKIRQDLLNLMNATYVNEFSDLDLLPGFVPTFESVICSYTGITKDRIRSLTRKREVVFARHMSFHYLSTMSNSSLRDIGRIYNKDHATVIHAKSEHQNLYAENFKGYADTYDKVIKFLNK